MSQSSSIGRKDRILKAVMSPVLLAADPLERIVPLVRSRSLKATKSESNASDAKLLEDIHNNELSLPKGIDDRLSDFPYPDAEAETRESNRDVKDNIYWSDGDLDVNNEKYSAKMLESPSSNDDRILKTPLLGHRKLSMSPKRLLSSISKHTATPITASVSRTKSVLSKLPSTKSDVKIERPTLSEQSIEGISRSFAGFLTTASVYAGFQDIEEDEQQVKKVISNDELEDEEPATSNENTSIITQGSLDKMINNNDDFFGDVTTISQHSPNPNTEINLANDENTYLKDYDTEGNRSKFELSVANKLASSKDQKNDTISNRAAALSSKLKTVFNINNDEEFVSDYSCWLLGEVLLQGHLYITSKHILFFAFLPKKSKGTILKSSPLSVQSFHSLRLQRKWAVLKDQTFFLYANSTELYFPELIIDLRTALRTELQSSTDPFTNSEPVWLKIITESRTHWFQADNLDAARSWVTILKKQIFASRNKGDEVAIKIPLENIVDLELTSVISVTKNLRIKVIENAESFAVDDYFLMFFSKGDEAVVEIKKCIEGINTNEMEISDNKVNEASLVNSNIEIINGNISALDTSSYEVSSVDDYSDHLISELGDDNNFDLLPEQVKDRLTVPTIKSKFKKHKYPKGLRKKDHSRDEQLNTTDDAIHTLLTPPEKGKWNTKFIVQNIQTFTQNLISSTSISHFDETLLMEGLDPYFITNDEVRKTCQSRFIQKFSLNDGVKLVATYHAYLMKGLPVYGKLYIGDSDICFKSSIPGSGTTMILPLSDIENTNKEQGFRFGYYGLVVLIHGHEELFFEFGSQEARSDCEVQIITVLDAFKASHSNSEVFTTSTVSNDDSMLKSKDSDDGLSSAKIRLFENKLIAEVGVDVPIIIEEHPLIKTEVKPARPYRFTLLTIGSRGDVQPYIALGKGLLEQGHKVKIVTHSEFKDWIESSGIEFDLIAGDPSELMALMVNNPTISYSFIKEAKAKFKNWIDDLLVTSWKACQNTDVLIESPSSIGGIHIAEKMKIPYFRAFTMPWTRTRAYPHAFLVPDQRLGGAYNYMTHVAFENGYWRGTSYQVNKWRVETLGLPKTNLANMELSSIPFLYNMSPVIFPPSVDFAEWVKVTGYWFLNESSKYTPPEPLLAFINKARNEDKKIVYIGFGSIVVENPKELTEAIVEAVLNADVRCILNKGWSERGSTNNKAIEIELPSEIYNAGAIPHDWLFKKVDAAVHHGGSGTTGASLRFGLPTIIKPFFGDQKFYANRVEDLGCGIALKSLNSKDLAKAIREATTNKRIIEKAKLIGKAIRAENGVKTAINSIYSMMDYAKKVSVRKAEKETKDFADESEEDMSPENVEGSWLMV